MEARDILQKLRPIHPFPARMAPAIAMSELLKRKDPCLKVLDPMVGSGTTIVLARMVGHRAYGIDLDPLAALLAETWASSHDASALLDVGQSVLSSAHRRLRHLKLRHAYPTNADAETKRFARYWFDPTARMQLRALADAIGAAPLSTHQVF